MIGFVPPDNHVISFHIFMYSILVHFIIMAVVAVYPRLLVFLYNDLTSGVFIGLSIQDRLYVDT